MDAEQLRTLAGSAEAKVLADQISVFLDAVRHSPELKEIMREFAIDLFEIALMGGLIGGLGASMVLWVLEITVRFSSIKTYVSPRARTQIRAWKGKIRGLFRKSKTEN